MVSVSSPSAPIGAGGHVKQYRGLPHRGCRGGKNHDPAVAGDVRGGGSHPVSMEKKMSSKGDTVDIETSAVVLETMDGIDVLAFSHRVRRRRRSRYHPYRWHSSGTFWGHTRL